MIPSLSDKRPKSRTGQPEWPFGEDELQCISFRIDPENSHASRDLPTRMIFSIAFPKSVKMASTSSSPASTAMISALGFVYLLAKMTPRTTVKV